MTNVGAAVRKRAVAEFTREGFLARVHSDMTIQLGWTRKCFAAKWRHPGLVRYRGGWRSARLRQWVVQIAGGHAALQTTASSKAALVVGHNAGGQSATMDIGKGSVRWERSY